MERTSQSDKTIKKGVAIQMPAPAQKMEAQVEELPQLTRCFIEKKEAVKVSPVSEENNVEPSLIGRLLNKLFGN